jgi:hypothetical protein
MDIETKKLIRMVEIREKRDNLLRDTDWWALVDRTITQPEKDYRQALRDITINLVNDSDGLPTAVFPDITN